MKYYLHNERRMPNILIFCLLDLNC